MDYQLVAILAVLIFAAAVLYSSVGHAGASGYLAVMALAGLAPDVMKPTAFILVNSIAGLLGHLASVSHIPIEATWWGIAALAGGWIGSELGSRHLKTVWLCRLLGVVLLIAGFKLMLT